MEFVTGTPKKSMSKRDLAALVGQTVTLDGMVHALRPLGGVTFLTLRLPDGAVQCVAAPELLPGDLCEECAVTLTGQAAAERRAPGGVEVRLTGLEVLSRPAQPMPVPVSKGRLKLNLDTELGLRPVVLRAMKERAVFKIQEGLSRAFREYLTGQGFTEVHTPKIVHAGAEGGSNIFRLDS